MRNKIVTLLLLTLGFCSAGFSQTPAPPDVPISHVNVSATFTGYDAGGKVHAANIDTLGVEFTAHVTVAYEHIQIPDLSQRYELGVVNYHNTFPKIKGLLFDSSNFVYSFSAGVGKFLSPEGNSLAWTVSPTITYPIAGHMGWQIISYQYVKAFNGPANGLVNKSFQSASTGPIFYF
jgi:hypothetical protein